ncbi:PKD domain-containing protein [Paenibacillus sp. CC-CFT747]|nr:PKD domain-containing protein [Paenibacillus sp. CC-CFT747]
MRKTLIGLLIMVVLLAGFPLSKAQAFHQFVVWTYDYEAFRTFEANQEIRIYEGAMEYVAACPEEGTEDFLMPWTDIYIVPAGSVTEAGQELEDAGGGKPNSVMAMTASGVFISEPIGYTAPVGKIGPGKYDLVFDECQDGKYNPFVDKIIKNSFEVDYSSSDPIPPLDLTKLKEDAGKAAERWEKYKEYMEKLFALAKAADENRNPNEKFVDFLMRSGLTDPRKGTLIQMANQAKHYEGIADDPPDPNYQQVTPLGSRPAFDFLTNDPLDIAEAAVGTAAGTEQAINQALLSSLERYQGADAASHGQWALSHARAIQKYANLLDAQLTRTNAAMTQLFQALAADKRPLDATAAALEQLRSRIVSTGFTVEELTRLRSLGYSDEEIEQVRAGLAAKNYLFTKADFIDFQSDFKNDNGQFGADLYSYAGSFIANLIETLKADPSIPDKDPVVSAGGPYSGTEGSAIYFNATASGPSSIVKYEWDLDGDGSFNDGTGSNVTFTYTQPFRGLAGVKVTDSEGFSQVAYSPVEISEVNKRPVLTAYSPSFLYADGLVGEPLAFQVTAADPEGQPVAVQWYADGAPAGTGAAYSYTPSTAGIHIVEAEVSDGQPTGGTVRIGWMVTARVPLPAAVQLTQTAPAEEVGKAHAFTASVTDEEEAGGGPAGDGGDHGCEPEDA